MGIEKFLSIYVYAAEFMADTDNTIQICINYQRHLWRLTATPWRTSETHSICCVTGNQPNQYNYWK